MFEEYQICPFTGLRSFTEEESIYFKGREDDIQQATHQLQRNKFLMLTGASGDGKSSLVYAGIVPNARAGFLKSKYTQWCVADFRPERAPFKNLCKTVARQLEINNVGTVESELQHGFSALIDLYRNSKRFIDAESIIWKNADDKQQAVLKRSAANLMIIVDQFEEFFTNPENYHQGVPSRDSNLVLNLLLETSRMALEEDLPIYIVFTMRSDYIGQCAAFRSLPEYIGFSQFFVPRLNRSQLQQVIEEPVALSGNRISRRLTERLIHDIAEGVDQLPILQHALNQIWHAANKGTDEMDLLHYAMVGGMALEELPDEFKKKFTEWFEALSEKVKACYHKPNLQNVLDTHANKLFESAAEGYRSKTGKVLSEDAVKDIIKKTFKCLTKIDQSRAVRNRMALKEIWQIVNRNDTDIETLGEVLNIFREPGNTFIRPFITDETGSDKLHEEDVLDITHESLIRNWEYLEAWAKEEFDNYSISLDFEKQLNRWVESDKSGDFLLSMGPLTYFETWFQNANPNMWWIARYLSENDDPQLKLTKASAILQNAKEFLNRSARKHLITRSIIKYGPARIAAMLAVIGLLVLSSFGVNNYIQKQNSFVLDKIKNESLALAGNPKVAVQNKVILLCENVKLGLTTIPEIAQHIDDPIERINAIAGMATALIIQGWHEPEKEIYQSLTITDSLLEVIPVSLSTPKYSEVLNEINQFMVTLDVGYYLNPTEKMSRLTNRNALRTAAWLKLIAKEKPTEFTDIKNFDMALEHAINHHALTSEEIKELILILSPFESTSQDRWVTTKFARDILSERGWNTYALAFNGLYQELAYLYAASGNSPKALLCVDTLMKYNQKYHSNDYSHMPDHAGNIAATFYQYNQLESMDVFVKGYCIRKKITEAEFYKIVVAHSRVALFVAWRLNYLNFWNRFTNLNLQLADDKQQSFFFKKYRAAIDRLNDKNEKYFYTALSYKDQAINKNMMLSHQGIKKEPAQINGWFDSAFFYYRKVDKKFLEKPRDILFLEFSRPAKYLFVFPDFMSDYLPAEQRGGLYQFYSSGRFLEYILSNRLFDEVYPGAVEIAYVEEWLPEYLRIDFFGNLELRQRIKPSLLSQLYNQVSQRKMNKFVNLNEALFILGHAMALANNPDSSRYYYQQIDLPKNSSLFGWGKQSLMKQIGFAISDLAAMNQFDEAYRFIQSFKKPVNRSTLYAFAAQEMFRAKAKSPVVNRLIDSARIEMLRVENTGVDQQSRFQFPYALALRMNEQDLDEAKRTIKNVSFKFIANQRISHALAFYGNLHEAHENIPLMASVTDKAVFLWDILYGYSEGLDRQPESWNEFTTNHRPWFMRAIDYDDENN